MLGKCRVLTFNFLLMLLALIVCWIDLLPKWQKCTALEVLVQEKTNEFAQNKKRYEYSPHPKVIQAKENMATLYLLMQEAGIQVNSLVFAKKQEREADKLLHFSAEATFTNVQRLIAALSQSSTFVLLDFSERMMAGEQHLFEGDILMLNQPKKISASASFLNINPFCLSATNYPLNTSVKPLLDGMQMVAFIEQGQKRQAIMKLTNGEWLTLEKGQILSQMQVIDVTRDSTVIQSAGKRLTFLINPVMYGQ